MIVTKDGKYKLADGRPVHIIRVFTEDYLHGRCVVGRYKLSGSDIWVLGLWNLDGFNAAPNLNLIEDNEVTVWLNCYHNQNYGVYHSRGLADQRAQDTRIACKKVTFTPGEGIDDE